MLVEWFIHYPEVHLIGQTHLEAHYQTWQQIILSGRFDLFQSETMYWKKVELCKKKKNLNDMPDEAFWLNIEAFSPYKDQSYIAAMGFLECLPC